MTECLQTYILKSVGYIILDRPKRRNAITEEMFVNLSETVNMFEQNDDVRVIVLQSAVINMFCAGADIGTMSDPDPASLEHHFDLLVASCNALRATAKPVVTIVNGDCLGAGCMLVAASDIVVASASARFALPEVFLSMAPILAMAELAQVVAMRTLFYWSATGRHVSAKEAREGGLITLALPDEDLEAGARGIIDDLLQHSTFALAGVKRTSNILTGHQSQLNPRELITDMIDAATHHEARSAIAAFIERKRRK